MTEIEQKALEMISAARKEHPTPDNYLIARNALCRALEQHEAFRQEVSDAVTTWWLNPPILFQQFIIPAPKPDPLVDAMNDINIGAYENIKTEYADTLRADIVRRFRAALEARGFEIREKNDD